jgi:hypothetical protein
VPPLAGVVSVTTGAAVSIMNVEAALAPVLPSVLPWLACALYVPSDRAAGACTDHEPPVAVTDKVRTALPVATVPE